MTQNSKETPAEAANPAGACLSRNTILLQNLAETAEKSSEDALRYDDLFRDPPGRLERDWCRFTTEVALAHASHGIPVHPLRSDGKEPVLEKFHDHATTDPNVIREWWLEGARYEYCNIGGSTDSYLVIDADAKVRQLDAVMLDFEFKYGLERGPLPPTWAYETPSKGNQFWYKMPPGFRVPCSQGKYSHDVLPDDVDFRGWHGNAVLPGSYTTKKHEGGKQVRWDGPYRWKEGCSPDDLPIAEAPMALIEMAWAAGGKSREYGTFQIEDVTGSVSGDGTIVGNDLPPACDLDTEGAMAAAREWLTGDLNAGAFPYSEFRRWLFPKGQYAPDGEHSFEGLKGTIQTLGDMGLSRDGIFEVLTESDGYNELKTGSRPWGDDELLAKIVGVLSKREKPLGCGYAPPRYPAEIVFSPVAMTILAGEVGPDSPDAANLGPKIPLTSDDWRFWAWVNGDDWSKGERAEAENSDEAPPYFREALPYDAPIERRVWVVARTLACTFVTALIGDSGTGKTQWIAQFTVAIASGKNLTGQDILKKSRVWYINNEDDESELDRRVSAARMQHEISDAELLGDDGRSNLIVGSGVGHGLMLVERDANGVLREGKKVVKIIAMAKRHNVGVLILDPVVEFHEGDEGNNPEMKAVVAAARRIAREANCAVMLAFHTRKPPAGDNTGHKGNPNALRGASSQNAVARITLTLDNMSAKEARAFGITEADRRWYLSLSDGKSNLSMLSATAQWYRRTSVTIQNGEEIGNMIPVTLEQTETASMFERLAETLAVRWPGPDVAQINAVIDFLPEHERAPFGTATNRGRIMKERLAEIDPRGLGIKTRAGVLKIEHRGRGASGGYWIELCSADD